MGMNFPNSPIPGQVYTPVGGYSYVFLDGVWRIVQDAQSILTADTRNRIVNGAMQISQENGNTGGAGSAYYAADQWVSNVLTTGTVQFNRVSAITPRGSPGRLVLACGTVDTALTTTENASIRHNIEGIRIGDFQWGTA